MAYFKYQRFLEQRPGNEFDDLHEPGATAPLSGIYRCEICGRSATALHGRPLPGSENHPEHSDGEPILWRLIVEAHLK